MRHRSSSAHQSQPPPLPQRRPPSQPLPQSPPLPQHLWPSPLPWSTPLKQQLLPQKNPDSADFDTDNPELTRKLFDMAGLFGQKGGWQEGANGQSTWSDQVNDNVQPAVDQCIRQDLNFAFG